MKTAGAEDQQRCFSPPAPHLIRKRIRFSNFAKNRKIRRLFFLNIRILYVYHNSTQKSRSSLLKQKSLFVCLKMPFKFWLSHYVFRLAEPSAPARRILRFRPGRRRRTAPASRPLPGEMPGPSVYRCGCQKSALPTVRGWGRTSRMLETPVRYITSRSKPRPKPACLQEP